MSKARLLQGDIPPDLLNQFSADAELAIDCEMMGLNPRRDRLCVVQMAGKTARAIVQIDEKTPYPGLKSLFENAKIQKIFHFARMDCLFLQERLGITVANIFCTKVASRIARTYTDRHGLKELVREICGETMDKTNQTSDWGREVLTDDQVFYAEGDVKYLFDIKNRLIEMLRREARLDLALQAMAFLPTRVSMDRLGFGDIFEH